MSPISTTTIDGRAGRGGAGRRMRLVASRGIAMLTAGALVVGLSVAMAPVAEATVFELPRSLPCDGSFVTGLGANIIQGDGTDLLGQKDDRYSTPADRPLVVESQLGLLANDKLYSGTNNTPLFGYRVFLFSQPSQGSVELNWDGSFTYEPRSGLVTGNAIPGSKDYFSYLVYAANGNCSNPATVTIDLGDAVDAPRPPDLAPVVQQDSYPADWDAELAATSDGIEVSPVRISIPAGKPYTVPAPGVLRNDSNPYRRVADKSNLRAELVAQPTWVKSGLSAGTIAWGSPDPASGVLEPLGGFTFTPAAEGSGLVRFSYRTCYIVVTGFLTTCSQPVLAFVNVSASVLAGPDSLVTPEGTDVVLYDNSTGLAMTSVLSANDTDNVPGDVYDHSYSAPKHGRIITTLGEPFDFLGVLLQKQVYRYVPDPGFVGVDSFTYRRCAVDAISLPEAMPGEFSCSAPAVIEIAVGDVPAVEIVNLVVTSAAGPDYVGAPFTWTFNRPVRGTVSAQDPLLTTRQGVLVRPASGGAALTGTYACSLGGVPVTCGSASLWDRITFRPAGGLTSGSEYVMGVNETLNWIGTPSPTIEFDAIDRFVARSSVVVTAPSGDPDTQAPDTAFSIIPGSPSPSQTAGFEFSGTDDREPLAGFECSLDGAPFLPCASPRSIPDLADGSHTFEVRARDASDNVDPTPASRTWLVDTTAPSATVTSGPDPSSTTGSATLEFTGSDGSGSGVAGFRCRLDGAAFAPCTSPVTYTGLADGPHNFLVYAVDAAGNEPAVFSLYTWNVDTGAVLDTVDPETAIGSTPANPSSSAAAAFGFSGTDDSGSVAGFECSLDGGAFAACAAPKAYSALADGSHTFQVRAVDAAGNTDATPATYTWVVDTAAPDTSISTTPTNPAASSAASFSFAGIDGAGSGVASFQCSLDGSAFSACASPLSYLGLSDGSHTFQVRAVDVAGNVDATPATFTWVVDATAPDTTITSNPPAVTTSSGASFSFTGTDSAGEVLSFQCSLDNAAFTACTSPSTYTGLSSNQHTFRVRAVDAAGNVDATPATYRWQSDYISPETILMGGPANPSSSSMATFSFNGFDGTGSGVASFRCSLDGRAFTECGVRTQAQTYTDLADGSHTFQVQAVDAANNGDPTPASYTWVIDTSAPTTTITSTPDALTSSTSAAFSFTGADAGGGAVVFECRLDGGSFAACSSPQSYSALAQGSHTFDVRAVDAAGNVDPTPETFTWEVGKLPQSITFGALDDKVEGDPGFSLSATASSNLTVAFASQTTDVCTVSGSSVTLVGAGTCTIVATQDGDATYEAADPVTRSFDVAAGVALAAPGSVQFSDRLTVSATITGKHAGTVAFTLDGAAFCTATASTLTGEASCSAVVPKPAGSYDVRARFTPTDPLRGPVSATRQVSVDAEGATVGYTGPQLVTTATSSATTASVALRAVVTQADDGDPGDLTKAKVVFDIFRSTNLTTTPDQSVTASVSSTGVASASVTLGLDSFVVVPRLSTAPPVYFAGPRGDAQVVTVAQPLSGASATGGGWVIDPGTGSVPVAISPTNRKGSFGLNVRYKKGTTTPTGQAVYTFRGADGYVYIMKSTSWVSGAAAFRSGAASFSGKANVTVLDPRTGQIVSGLGGGNFSYRIDVTDGSTDTYALRLYDAKGRLYHLVGTPGSNGAVTPVAVKAGNITVRTR